MAEELPEESLIAKELDGEKIDYNSFDSWEAGVRSQCDQFVSNIRSKKEELQEIQRETELLKKSLEEKELSLANREKSLEAEYQIKIEELEEKRSELDALKTDLEEAYLKKLEAFESEKKRMNELHEVQDGKIKLDVGGHMFTTSKATLCRDLDSMFAVMFSGRHMNIKSDDGSYFVDRDGTYFRYILNYLRGVIENPSDLPEDVSMLRELRSEADFYQLKGLAELLNEALDMPAEKCDFTQEEITEMMSTLVRGDVGRNIIRSNSLNLGSNDYEVANATEENPAVGRPHFVSQNMTKSKLNFNNKKLNGISFSHTTFLHNVSFRNAFLVGASFYGCEFGVGVKVNFNYADLTGCDFRQCKGKEPGSNLTFGHGGGLVSGSSSDTFLQMVQQGRISFKKAKVEGSLFDPKVSTYLNVEK